MVAAVGSPSLSIAGLEAQVARYQHQLSDCVNCSSASTIEGKTNIQKISGQISETKGRLSR